MFQRTSPVITPINQATLQQTFAQKLETTDAVAPVTTSTPESVNEVIIEFTDIVAKTKPDKQCNKTLVPFYPIPAINAGMDAVQTAIGLHGQGKGNMFIYVASTIDFLVVLGIDAKYTLSGIGKTMQIIKQRHLPENWVTLSKGKEACAFTISVVVSTTKAITDATLNRYFLMELPQKFNFASSIDARGWEAFAWIMAGFTAVGDLTSEGKAVYKKSRELLAGKKSEYTNAASRYISPTLGSALGTCNSVNDWFGTVAGLKYVFKVNAGGPLAAICIVSTFNGGTSFFINGVYTIQVLDKFIGSFVPPAGIVPCYKDPVSIISFLLAASAGGLTAYAAHGLSKELLFETLDTLGLKDVNILKPLVQGIACSGAVSNLVTSTGSIYPLCNFVVSKIGSALDSIYHQLSCCSHPKRKVEDEFFAANDASAEPVNTTDIIQEREPLLAPQGGANRLFTSQTASHRDEDYAPTRSCGIQ